MKYVIKVNNLFGEWLFVCSTAYTGNLNYKVKILKFAKKFKTSEDAALAIRGFNSDRVTFEIVSLADAKDMSHVEKE